jgi:hypothetical protein
MTRPLINAKSDLLFRKQLNAALDYVEGLGGGGGSSIATGSAVLSFGSAPGTNAIETVITGQTGISAGSTVKAWISAEATGDHNAYEHAVILPRCIGISCGNIVAGVGFTIFASTDLRLTGDVSCKWEWI